MARIKTQIIEGGEFRRFSSRNTYKDATGGLGKNQDERTKWDLSDMSSDNRKRVDELALQYHPLVIKIATQMYHKLCEGCYWEDIVSMANEGLALAIRDFDPNKSGMKFTQYAAYAIRNNILNCMATDLHCVTLNSYAITKMKAEGKTTVISTQMSTISGETGGEDSYSREARYGLYEEDVNAGEPNPIQQLVEFVQANFNESDQELFFKVYGLNGEEETPAIKIAKARGVTCGAISQKMKRIMTKIKDNEVLLEALASLL